MSEAVRLQKVLASCGVASRRASEELIRQGRVRVDGRVVTELGTRVDPRRQRVEVDGKRVVYDMPVYVVLHKPRGVMSTLRDPEGRPTVGELVADLGVRVAPVGRLDFNTSGVMLLSNDGDFAAGLSHARAGVPKIYLAKVAGKVDDACIERLSGSIQIDATTTRPAQVRVVREQGGKTWLSITLHEGKNRQVRRLVEHAGLQLMRLSRVSYAGISVDDLPPGRWRALGVEELKQLKKAHGVPRRVRAGERAVHAGVPVRGGASEAKQSRRARGDTTKPAKGARRPSARDSSRSARAPGRRPRPKKKR